MTVDESLHAIGRHLGVAYDEDGYAKPSTVPPMMISATESLALYVQALRDIREADERARRRSRLHLVK